MTVLAERLELKATALKYAALVEALRTMLLFGETSQERVETILDLFEPR